MSKQNMEIPALGKEMGEVKTKMSQIELAIKYINKELSKQASKAVKPTTPSSSEKKSASTSDKKSIRK